MDITQFNRRIIDSCVSQCKPAVVLLVIGVLLLVKDLIYYNVTKKNDGLSLLNFFKIFNNRFTTKEQIALKLIGIVALLILIAWTIVPAYKDISNQQYNCVFGQYTYEIDNQDSIFTNGRVKVETKDDEFYLELPANWSEDEFPAGTMQGMIYYSKESKVFLFFVSST